MKEGHSYFVEPQTYYIVSGKEEETKKNKILIPSYFITP
jgi:hypothetical protein